MLTCFTLQLDQFLNTKVLQGNVATSVRCDGIFIITLLQSF